MTAPTDTPTLDVPDVVRYGRVEWSAAKFIADTTDDGTRPDQIPATGTVDLIPRIPVVRWPTATPPLTSVIMPITCRVIDGHLTPPAGWGDTPGINLVSSIQPDGEPNRIQWQARFHLDGVTTQPGTIWFDVPDDDTIDLTTVVPTRPAPGVITVVSTADRIAAEQAAQTALAAAQAAIEAATGLFPMIDPNDPAALILRIATWRLDPTDNHILLLPALEETP